MSVNDAHSHNITDIGVPKHARPHDFVVAIAFVRSDQVVHSWGPAEHAQTDGNAPIDVIFGCPIWAIQLYRLTTTQIHYFAVQSGLAVA